MTPWRLAAGNTHLYPGARLRCLDEPGAARMRKGDAVLVEFSGGNVVAAEVARAHPAVIVLAVPSHRTGRGAPIAARRWRLVPGARPGELSVQAREDG
jgi:hypothetical protein